MHDLEKVVEDIKFRIERLRRRLPTDSGNEETTNYVSTLQRQSKEEGENAKSQEEGVQTKRDSSVNARRSEMSELRNKLKPEKVDDVYNKADKAFAKAMRMAEEHDTRRR
tara:strand:- start:169 stop:498 length:330 start_codon:yes stop_codon:yes gene_type:complete